MIPKFFLPVDCFSIVQLLAVSHLSTVFVNGMEWHDNNASSDVRRQAMEIIS
jgi:hypothetical protein